MRRAQQMRALARRRAGDPAAFARSGRDPPVERGRQLQRDERPAGSHALEEPGIDLGRLVGAQPAFDGDPGLAQPRETAAGDPRVRVLDRGDDARAPRRRSAPRRKAASVPNGSTVRA